MRVVSYDCPCAKRRIAVAVAASAGKNDSIASSDKVMSIGVPKIVAVLKNVSRPAFVFS